jgi:hypothetical protein
MRKWAIPLLAVYLILAGVLPLLKVGFASADLILSVLAIAAGALLLLNRQELRLPRGLGGALLAVWLILVGGLPLLNLSLPSQEVILGLLAAAAGILLLLRR